MCNVTRYAIISVIATSANMYELGKQIDLARRNKYSKYFLTKQID